MEKVNVDLLSSNNKKVEPFETARPFLTAYNKLSEKITIPARALAATAAVRNRRLVQAGPNLMWSIPATFNDAGDLRYLPLRRQTIARLRSSVWAESSPDAEFCWVEEIDLAGIDDEEAIVLVDPEVDDIVDPHGDGDAINIPGLGEVGVIPVELIKRNAGPLYPLFRGYGGTAAPRRYEFK